MSQKSIRNCASKKEFQTGSQIVSEIKVPQKECPNKWRKMSRLLDASLIQSFVQKIKLNLLLQLFSILCLCKILSSVCCYSCLSFNSCLCKRLNSICRYLVQVPNWKGRGGKFCFQCRLTLLLNIWATSLSGLTDSLFSELSKMFVLRAWLPGIEARIGESTLVYIVQQLSNIVQRGRLVELAEVGRSVVGISAKRETFLIRWF